ncbi:hypothetical protein CLOACE_01870 [Clostridium acetireducens DSM 10703]|uniref:Uncharacterized protein n=1 Tax=Clostridium acetireducens DSM 10703 TaxID=1121290 RepID=A0A1E8F1R4_9CLOT|nr:hypothetical protein [Clostridium acetireducens]OFI07583.1 hypothetical protein CLOACE_01870 [Clostridium acetireducens DSM 10703]
MYKNFKYILILLIISLSILTFLNYTLKNKSIYKSQYLNNLCKIENKNKNLKKITYSDILNSLKYENIDILKFKENDNNKVNVEIGVLGDINYFNDFVKNIKKRCKLANINYIEINESANKDNYNAKMNIEFIKESP